MNLNLFADQTPVDSLKNLLKSELTDTERVNVLLDLSWKLKSSEPDNAKLFADKAYELADKTNNKIAKATALKNIGIIFLFKGDYNLAEEYHQKALIIFQKNENQNGISGCYNNLGLIKEFKGEFIPAVDFYKKSLKIDREINNENGIASSLNNLGNIFQKKGNYSKAIEYYIKVLSLREKQKDDEGIGDVYNNIGALNEKQNEYDEALKNYQKALILYVETNDRKKSANVLHNIGLVLTQEKHYAQALEYYFQALSIRKELGAKKGIASTNKNIGNTYLYMGNLQNAFKYFNSALSIYTEIGEQPGVSDTKILLANYYFTIKNYSLAHKFLEEARNIALKIKLNDELKDIYKLLSKIYAHEHNFSKAYSNRLKYEQLKDSLAGIDNNRKIIELQLQYEFEKNEQERELRHEKQKLATLKQINRQKIINYSLIIGLSGIILLVLITFRAYILKKKDNSILQAQKKEILNKNEKLEHYQEELISQKEHLQAQQNIIIAHRDKLAYQQQKITDSIQYARRIQQSQLPNEQIIESFFSDYFLINLPKDIVSGDFFWLKNKDNKIYLAVADATGHGIPGAFMSLLGVSILNELITTHKNLKAGEYLDLMSEKLKEYLHQNEDKNSTKDGIDIAFCIIDKKNDLIQFAGAYASLFIIYKNISVDKKYEIEEIKGDKMPTGYNFLKKQKHFTTQNIPFYQEQQFYLFTDGIVDQFGGAYGRKFLIRNFKNELLKISDVPMKGKKEKILDVYNHWKSDYEQVDDILILGFEN